MLKPVVISAFLVISTAASAQVIDPAQRFDGKLNITAVQGATCAAFGVRTGLSLPAIFRARTAKHPNIPEAVSVNLGRGALILVADDKDTARDDGTLRGAGQRTSGTYIFDAARGSTPQAILTLTVTPQNISESTPTVTLKGTVQNFGVVNCKVTVNGTFANRDL